MGNPATLESSGFVLKAPRQPVSVLPPPSNLRAEPGQEPASVRYNTSRGGRLYEIECAPQGTGPWTPIYKRTRASCLATKPDSGHAVLVPRPGLRLRRSERLGATPPPSARRRTLAGESSALKKECNEGITCWSRSTPPLPRAAEVFYTRVAGGG
jgi:hypothetical protein